MLVYLNVSVSKELLRKYLLESIYIANSYPVEHFWKMGVEEDEISLGQVVISRGFLQCQKQIVIYYVKKITKQTK